MTIEQLRREVMKYRKTALIEAVQWWKMGDHPAVVLKSDRNRYADEGIPWIDTLEGGHIVTPGDWIATGIKGEHWPIKPDVFAATYEPADAHKPTFEGDEEEVLEWLTDQCDITGCGCEYAKIRALLDAKDAEIAKMEHRLRHEAALTNERDTMLADLTIERDAALSRAEQAEAALAEERKAMSDAASYAIEDLREWLVNYLDAYDRDTTEQAIATLSRFVLPAKPAVDPLVGVLREAFPVSLGEVNEQNVRDFRAAIERAGGVKAVFGKGV